MITAASVLLNPYGYHLLVFLYKSLSLPREITEWAPVSLQDTSFIHLKVLVAVVAVTIIFSGRKNHGWEVAILLFTGFFAIKHQRHMVFFGMTAAQYLATGFTTLLQATIQKNEKAVFSNSLRVSIAIVFTTAAVYHVHLGSSTYARSNWHLVVDPNRYPVSALEFIRHNRIHGNLFVLFDWGEQAIWKLYPNCKVSIDGRFRTVYPESVIRDHFIPADNVEELKQVLEKYPADILLYPRTPLTAALVKTQKEWVYVYSDPLAFIFLRRNEKNRNLLSRFETSGFAYLTIANPSSFP